MSIDNIEIWKSRAIERREENKALKKRIKEITQSRDNWKNKYKDTKIQKDLYESELNKIKKKLNEIIET